MSNFKLKIYSSDKIFYDGECSSLIIPTTDGSAGILANHADMIAAVVEGELHLKDPNGKWITAAVSGGFAEVIDGEVSILVATAELPEEIDIRRAQEAKDRAEEQLRQKQSLHEYHSSQASLARAMARLKTSSHKNWKI